MTPGIMLADSRVYYLRRDDGVRHRLRLWDVRDACVYTARNRSARAIGEVAKILTMILPRECLPKQRHTECTTRTQC